MEYGPWVRAYPWRIAQSVNGWREGTGHMRQGGAIIDLVNGGVDEHPLWILHAIAPYFAKPNGAAPVQKAQK
jgi:hypothetical protein